MKKQLINLLQETIAHCIDQGTLQNASLPLVDVERPREEAHGDYASNIAMMLASGQKQNPRKIAEAIIRCIQDNNGLLEKVEIAGPGFMNFFIKRERWFEGLQDVEKKGERYGESEVGKGRRIQVEFVSANPTGPLHIGHARGAALGDVIANVLALAGYAVHREYYINDAGNQMNTLGKSVCLRYFELIGNKKEDFPATCYQGEYITDLARELLERHGTVFQDRPEKEVISFFADHAADSIMKGIKEDLNVFGVTFDSYFSEKDLYRNEGVETLLQELQAKGHIYREGNTLWFKSSEFGDEKDRVVVRGNGEPTYFAGDIAYHLNKYLRGFDILIDIWGADHHGYIPRMKAGIQALERPAESFHVLLVQLVNLLRNGVPVAMSTRAGEFVTMREVTDEVGKDAARYNFLMRRSNSHLDFDLELAKKQSNENPVYYVQYAHARTAGILRTAAERGYAVPAFHEVDFSRLTNPEEIMLVKMIDRFPDLIEEIAQTLEPHRLTFFTNELASVFHSYYNKHKVVSEEGETTRARLFLIQAVRTVIGNALRLLGVSAPERM